MKKLRQRELNSGQNRTAHSVTGFLLLGVAYKKRNVKLSRNKSEETHLKEFDSVTNVRREYTSYSFK